VSWKVHQRLVARDGPHCYWCGDLTTRETRTRDHLVPRAEGGSDSIRNQVLACETCNQARGCTPLDVWADAMNRAITSPVPGEHASVTARALARAAMQLSTGPVSSSARRRHRRRVQADQPPARRPGVPKPIVEWKHNTGCGRCGVTWSMRDPDGGCDCPGGPHGPWPPIDPAWAPELF
jgi:hypothetical protein